MAGAAHRFAFARVGLRLALLWTDFPRVAALRASVRFVVFVLALVDFTVARKAIVLLLAFLPRVFATTFTLAAALFFAGILPRASALSTQLGLGVTKNI